MITAMMKVGRREREEEEEWKNQRMRGERTFFSVILILELLPFPATCGDFFVDVSHPTVDFCESVCQRQTQSGKIAARQLEWEEEVPG